MLTLLRNWSQSSGSGQICDSGWPLWESLGVFPRSQRGRMHARVHICMRVSGQFRDRCGFRRVLAAPAAPRAAWRLSLSDGSVPREIRRLFPQSLSPPLSVSAGQRHARKKTHGGALRELGSQNKSRNETDYRLSGSRADSDYRLVNGFCKMTHSSLDTCLLSWTSHGGHNKASQYNKKVK